ncbi:MAG: ATP-dependent DNA helicase RecG [Gammaproteobacteria bacterium]
MTESTAVTPPAAESVTTLKGVGPALAEKLGKLGISTVADLLFHLPLRYEDRSRVYPIGALFHGRRAMIEAQVELTEVVFRGRRSLLCRVSDATGQLTLRFFYFSRAQQAQLKRGALVRCFGEVRRGPGGLEMVHPEYRLVRENAPAEVHDTLTPVYPITEGVTQPRLRVLTDLALDWLNHNPIPELLPPGSFAPAPQLSLEEALRLAHRPSSELRVEALNGGEHVYLRRLAFEELVAQRLSLNLVRETLQSERAPVLEVDGPLVAHFLESLPFELTGAQQRVVTEIAQDLARPQPALRLLQGDVGSGKTVVAAVVALMAAQSGGQAALMAPTELLAEQHLRSLTTWFEPLGVTVGWLVGRMRSQPRREALAAIADGSAQVVVGTHALFQDGVDFNNLTLAIIDEQHRFGVHQRLALRDKGGGDGACPHQLVMTATPIPRTLTMTHYADLDVSIIDELPPGRTPVATAVVSANRRPEVVNRVATLCAEGQQAYWVCPLVEESELLEAQAAEETAANLTEMLPGLTVALIHGRMSSSEKDGIMRRFAAGEVQLLVATTVIEVGVDVPNASLMIIENAERMGLSQLHQLRGRVGRGAAKSHCVLLYKSPLSKNAKARLGAVRDSNDGFFIAQRDLELRGPGEVLGTRQAGIAQLKVADLTRDADMLDEVAATADPLLQTDAVAARALVRRWVGAAARYVQV